MLYTPAIERFLERVKTGNACLGVHISSLSAQIVEMFGLLGLDFIIIGQEVEAIEASTTEHLLRAAVAAGTMPLVKVRRNSLELIEDALNIGAPFITLPHVTTPDELDAAVRAAQFRPVGRRPVCPTARYAGYGSFSLKQATDASEGLCPIIPMIEDKEALEHIDELMSHPDVPIYEIGPFDLSQSLGLSPDQSYNNAPVLDAVEKIGAAARKYGKYVIAPFWYPQGAADSQAMIEHQKQELVRRGITLLYNYTDIMVLARAFRGLLPLRELSDKR